MINKKALVIGAGVSGLAVAYKLSQSKWQVTVVERDTRVGGLATTYQKDGMSYDLGPHKLYTQIKEVDVEMRKLLGKCIVINPKTSSLRFFGAYLDYPVRIGQILRKMGPGDLFKFGFDYGIELLKSPFYGVPPKNSEEYFIRKFGRTAYERVFRPLFEKVYGNPVELDANLAITRVPFPSLLEIVFKAFTKTDKSPHLSAKEFYYPQEGILGISNRMVEILKKNKGTLETGFGVNKIVINKGVATSVELNVDGKVERKKADVVISTMYLGDLINAISPTPPKVVVEAAKGLRYRALTVVYVVVGRKRVTDKSFIFFPERDYVFQRISEQSAFSEGMVKKGKTIIMAEIAHNTVEEVDPKILAAKVVSDLEKCGLLKPGEVEECFWKQKNRIYPVYDLFYKQNLKVIFKYLARIKNLYTLGRQGMFLYTNIDHGLDMGFKLAEYLTVKSDKEGWDEIEKKFLDYRIVD